MLMFIYLFIDSPKIISVPSGTMEFHIGDLFEIVCEARGIPQPVITWKWPGRGQTNELDNTRRMMVEVKDRSLAGPIECIATNGAGEAKAGVNLIVLCKHLSALFKIDVFFFS